MKRVLFILFILTITTTVFGSGNVEISEGKLDLLSPDDSKKTSLYRDDTDSFIDWSDGGVLYLEGGNISFDNRGWGNSKFFWDDANNTLIAYIIDTNQIDANVIDVNYINVNIVDVNYIDVNSLDVNNLEVNNFTDGILTITDGNITNAVNGTFSGTLTAGTLTDGTLTITGGQITGATDILSVYFEASGNIYGYGEIEVAGDIITDSNFVGDTIIIPTNSASALTIRTAVPKTAILISTHLDPFVIDFNKAALVGMSRWALYDELGTGGELLSFKVNENLTGNRSLYFITGDSDRTITLSGNPTLGDWFDQAVKAASNVNFGTIGCGAITSTGNSLFTGTGGARPITIAQGGDNLGLRVNGYDDMSGNYGLFHLNSAGELSVEAKLGMALLAGAAGGNYAFNIKSSGNKDVDFNYNNSATGGLRWWGGTNVEKWEVDKDGNMSLAGSLTTGDGGTTNYTAISATGDVSFAGTATVWNDMQFQISDAKVTPASLLPSWEAFTANTSEYAFSVNDEVDTSANEIHHSWKEGTAGHAHIHITTKAINNAEVTYAKFTVTFAYADINEVWAEAPLTAEVTIANPTAALTNLYLDLGDITLTNYLIGAQMRCRVKRIAATTGTEYVGDIFITQVGIHFEEDTIGSKTETVK